MMSFSCNFYFDDTNNNFTFRYRPEEETRNSKKWNILEDC